MLEISLEFQMPGTEAWGFNFFPCLQVYKEDDRSALYFGWFLWGVALVFEEVEVL